MAANVESMMYVGNVPWHGFGNKVEEGILTADAINQAGLNWKVTAAPLYTSEEFGLQKVSHRAIVRETDQRVLGIVGPDYVPLQNTEAFNFFDPYVTAGEALIDTAGSLKNGQNIWVLARLNRAPIEVVRGDVVEKFLLLSNSHRGGVSVRVGFTPIRVVCSNTLAAAHGHGDSKLMRIHHGQQMIENLEKVQEIVNAADAEFEATAEQYRFLARRNVSKQDLETFVKVVFLPKKTDGERYAAREKVMTETITRLFETGRGNDQAGVRGTYWALYNAATEFLSHEANRDEESRLSSLWFGPNHEKNADALVEAVRLAAV